MVKKGTDRSAKFNAKHDPYAIMLRLKALQNLAKLKFASASESQSYLDQNVILWLADAKLSFGQKGSLLDLAKEICYKWQTLSYAQKFAYLNEWASKGLPISIWNKLANKNNELLSLAKTHTSQNIKVSYDVDVFPYPFEQTCSVEEDFVKANEILPLPTETYTQTVWRQKTDKYGNVDYLCVWSSLDMNKTVGIDLKIETVQPLLFDKTIEIKCYIDTPYQSPQDKFPALGTSYEIQSGESESQDQTATLATLNSNVVLATPLQLYGQVLYFNFNENAGTIAHDSSGNRNDGTIVTPHWTDGKYGKALQFLMDGSYVYVLDNPTLALTDAVTLSSWFKRTGHWTDHWRGVVGKSDVYPWSYLIFCEFDSNNSIHFSCCINGIRRDADGFDTELNVWVHVVGTYNATTGIMKFYKNGSLFSILYLGEGLKITNTPSSVYTGIQSPHAIVDEVHIFNRALSDSEVMNLYLTSPDKFFKSQSLSTTYNIQVTP